MGRPPAVVEDRFMDKVHVAVTGCWLWMRPLTTDGYGKFYRTGRTERAHRSSYEIFRGPIPRGMTIDHLCRVRHCVNPAHLEPVTNRENIRRGRSGRFNAAKTQCPRGHEYVGRNIYWQDGHRSCRTCRREVHRGK